MFTSVKDKKGFTLIELVIVTAVIGIAAAVTIPSIIGWLPALRVNSAARDLTSEMQLARMKAVTEKNNYVITFDTATQYTIHDDNDNDGNLDETGGAATNGDESFKGPISLSTGIQFGYVALETGTGGVAIPSSITFSGSQETFSPDGQAAKNGAVYLIPTQDIAATRRDRQRAITVIQTGRIMLWRYDSTSNPPWR